MNIPKAIEILENHQCDMPRNDVPDLIAAIRLGIEALERERRNRDDPEFVILGSLPSETEE